MDFKNVPINHKSIVSKFQEYDDIYIKPALLEFGGKGDSIIFTNDFSLLGEKIKSNKDNILGLLDLLYQYFNNYFNSYNDGSYAYVDLITEIFKKGGEGGAVNTQTYDGLKGDKKVRHIPEDTIYFHLLATIHMNIESLVDYDYREPLKNEKNGNGSNFLVCLLEEVMEGETITGDYDMLPKEYDSLFGVEEYKFELGVHTKPIYIDNGTIIDFILLSNTSLVRKVHEQLINPTTHQSDEVIRTTSVMKAPKSYKIRDQPYTTKNPKKSKKPKPDCQYKDKCYRKGNLKHMDEYNHLPGGGGRRTRKYGRKTRTKKNLRKCKTHKKRKTRRGRK